MTPYYEESVAGTLDPLVPRPLDMPTTVPLDPNADLSVLDTAKIMAAPDDPQDRPAWRAALNRWRDQAKVRIEYRDDMYADPGIQWAVQGSAVAILWIWDERLFDHHTGKFKVADVIADAEARFGGFDAVVLWHAYPIIGVDERNQFDFYRDIPDLPELVSAFQSAGVRVYLDYNPWDLGSRRSRSEDSAKVAELLKRTGADGVFLDTLREGAPQLMSALAGLQRPVALEGEVQLPLARVADHVASWAQWMADTPAPGVLRAHWFERRHMMHHTRRWNRDHTDEIQSAWVNGCGMMIWENVFGSWVGWNRRDAATWKSVRVLQQQFWPLLVQGEWVPLAELHPDAEAAGLYASAFTLDNCTLYTVINRGDNDYSGKILNLTGAEVLSPMGDAMTVPGRGIAAVILDPAAVWTAQCTEAAGRLTYDADAGYPARPASRLVPPRTRGIIDGPERNDWIYTPVVRKTVDQQFRLRETGMYDEVPFVEEWKPMPPRLHSLVSHRSLIDQTSIAVAPREVSNAEFAEFVVQSGYEPAEPHRFLAHFDHGRPRPGTEAEPVSYVNLADARAYCAWFGCRLPNEFEWQMAAADPEFRRRSPLVWNWTESEHCNGISRFAILKGGSDFQAQGSAWYFDGGPQEANFAAKILLAGRGIDRSNRIGFRTAYDLDSGSE